MTPIPPGRCGDFLQPNGHGPGCSLRHGHEGMHTNGFTHWSAKPVTPPTGDISTRIRRFALLSIGLSVFALLVSGINVWLVLHG